MDVLSLFTGNLQGLTLKLRPFEFRISIEVENDEIRSYYNANESLDLLDLRSYGIDNSQLRTDVIIG